jgi:hypothetical protein
MMDGSGVEPEFFLFYYNHDIASVLDPTEMGIHMNWDNQPLDVRRALRLHWERKGLDRGVQKAQMDAIESVIEEKRTLLQGVSSEEATNLLLQLDAAWQNAKITPADNTERKRTFIRQTLNLIENASNIVRIKPVFTSFTEARDLVDVELSGPRSKRRRVEPEPEPEPEPIAVEPEPEKYTWVGPILAAAILTMLAYYLTETPSHRLRMT